MDEIELDVGGTVVAVPRKSVRTLAEAAASRAGLSTRHRDLSVILGRALETGKATLQRGELRTLRAVLEERRDGFGPAAAELLRLAGESS